MFQMVVRDSVVGDHDTGWYPLSVRTIRRKIVPVAKNWPSNGETTVLLHRNVNATFTIYRVSFIVIEY